jgi:hypothetical protein
MGAAGVPAKNGPPLSPLQPELRGSRPSMSMAQSMRLASKRSRPLPFWRRKMRAHSLSEMGRS